MRWMAVAALAAALSTPVYAQPADPATTARTELEAVMSREAIIRELAGMGAMDRVVRERFLAARRQASDEDRARLEVEAWPIAEGVDQANTARMRDLLASHEGWFPRSQFGGVASDAAYSVVQHSGDLELMRNVLVRMEPLIGTDDLHGSQYARLYDRVATFDGRLQRYGTQGTTCSEGRYVIPADLEDPEHVDERRSALGLNPIAEYVEGLNQSYGRCTPLAGH